jgi:ABC-2 type transport system ATP-binding protein
MSDVLRYAVEARALTRKFGDFVAVDHISFAVKPGEIFGFLGPNGSGKTTTIRMLLGLIEPTAGEARVLDIDITREPEAIARRVGYMSQKFSLYPDLTADENLTFYGRAYGLRGRALKRRKDEALALTGLTRHRQRLTANLAGGWQQRLALAAAILHQPELLFLDEPTAGVDPVSRRNFWRLLYSLAAQKTTIFVTTHYMDEAEHCQNLAFIQRGRLVAEGSPQEMKLHQMPGEVLEVDCARADEAVQVLRKLTVFDEVALYGALIHVVTPKGVRANEQKPVIEAVLAKAGIRVKSVQRIAPSLEDVFIASVR